MRYAYLAGPMTGLSYAAANGWRVVVRNALLPRIECLSPLRGITEAQYAAQDAAACQRDFLRDFNDVRCCDLVFVNLLGSTRVSQGTIYEVAWAYAFRKPVVVAIENEGNPHDHPFLIHSQPHFAFTLEEAMEVTRSILLPD